MTIDPTAVRCSAATPSQRSPVSTDRRCGGPATFLLLLALVAGGCHDAVAEPTGQGARRAPLEVGVLAVRAKSVALSRDLPGRVSPLRMAEVRARVNGVVQRRMFSEGALVKKGDVLYQIESAPYAATLASATASLRRSQATVQAARSKVSRYEKLLPSNAVSQQDYDDARAELMANEADVLAAQAAVQAARINLDYTRVVAPIDGRIGISQVTEGAYVQATTATLLATVLQTDEVYVDLTQSTAELLRLRRAVEKGELETDEAGRAKVHLTLEDGSEYPQEGRLEFVDVSASETTSSVTLRAVFPNPDGILHPGAFVRATVLEGERTRAILVPQLAVSRDTRGEPIAYVLGKDGKIERRNLVASRAIGNQWLIDAGLEPGDQLIVDNLQKVKAGIPARGVEAKLPAEYLAPTTGK